MRHLIIYQNTAYFTDYYTYENCYMPGMVVITNGLISFDGVIFNEITEDHL